MYAGNGIGGSNPFLSAIKNVLIRGVFSWKEVDENTRYEGVRSRKWTPSGGPNEMRMRALRPEQSLPLKP